jgi:hypothetical protein
VAATETLPILHLSLITGGVLRDGAGGQLGRVDDVVVRLGADYPVVSGVLATVAGRRVFVPAEVVREIGHGYVELSEVRLDLRPFERRPEEVLLKQDVLDRQLINVEGARLVRTNEIELARVDGWYRVVGVDTGLRGLTRRVLPRRLAPRVQLGRFLDWASVEPFTGHVPTVRLRVPHPKLARLHPAQLADLVEAASHREGEEIMSALADEELEADVFEELTPSTSASSSRSAPTPRWRACWRAWSPTTPWTCWASWTSSGAGRFWSCCRRCRPGGCARWRDTTRPPPAG